MPQNKLIDADQDRLVDSTVRALSSGVTLGDVRGFDARHYEAAYAAGYTQYNAGRYEQAEKVFQFLVAHNPYDRRFTLALGSVKQVRGQYADALGYYGLCSSLDMMDPVPVLHMAECLIGLGKADDAREALGFVLRNATLPAHEPYKARAQGLIELLDSPASQGART